METVFVLMGGVHVSKKPSRFFGVLVWVPTWYLRLLVPTWCLRLSFFVIGLLLRSAFGYSFALLFYQLKTFANAFKPCIKPLFYFAMKKNYNFFLLINT
jgi:hypothetical protein